MLLLSVFSQWAARRAAEGGGRFPPARFTHSGGPAFTHSGGRGWGEVALRRSWNGRSGRERSSGTLGLAVRNGLSDANQVG